MPLSILSTTSSKTFISSRMIFHGGILSLMLCSFAAHADTPDRQSECSVKEYSMALKYQQKSAEIAALQKQTYKMATQRLKEVVASSHGNKKLAIMTDLDETAIDNTALLVRDMQECHDYTSWDTWGEWEQKGEPTLIPGAKEFFDYADKQGVSIFYVSDRMEEHFASTLATLKKLGLPQADKYHIRLLGPSKAERRDNIKKDYDLVMQLGDSLPDFSPDFKKAPLDVQHRLVEKYADHFGKDWIVLPNASYGSWSDATLTSF